MEMCLKWRQLYLHIQIITVNGYKDWIASFVAILDTLTFTCLTLPVPLPPSGSGSSSSCILLGGLAGTRRVPTALCFTDWVITTRWFDFDQSLVLTMIFWCCFHFRDCGGSGKRKSGKIHFCYTPSMIDYIDVILWGFSVWVWDWNAVARNL